MLDNDLTKHAAEFRGRIAAHQYEVSDEGIYFPQAKALAIGEYFHDTNGEGERTDRNLLPTQALNHLLSVALRDTAKLPAWYLAIFNGAYTPAAGITAAAFPAAAGELTSSSEGYAEAARPTWTPAAVANATIDNVASKAAFTIKTAGSIVIRGAALLSEQAKGSTAGVLMSVVRFSADRTHYNDDVFNLGYRVRLQAA